MGLKKTATDAAKVEEARTASDAASTTENPQTDVVEKDVTIVNEQDNDTLDEEKAGTTTAQVQETAADPDAPKAALVVDAGLQQTQGIAVVHRSTGMQAILDSMAADGMEGLTLNFNSFLNITLNTEFETSEGHTFPTNEFDVLFLGSRKKYVVNSGHATDDEREAVFTYDLTEIEREGSAVHEKILNWKAEGIGYKVKEYVEVYGLMIDDLRKDEKDSLEGRILTLSIPPTSTGKLGGYSVQTKLRHKGKKVTQVITHVARGTKVTSSAFPFYPWDFKYVRDASEDELTAFDS